MAALETAVGSQYSIGSCDQFGAWGLGGLTSITVEASCPVQLLRATAS